MTLYGIEKTLPLNGVDPKDPRRNLMVVHCKMQDVSGDKELYLDLRGESELDHYQFFIQREGYITDFLNGSRVSDPVSLEGRTFVGFFDGASLIGICPSEDLLF
ncbi:MAG: hypothetical protein AABW89_02805 [Nanoarchaeota archaeon]